MKHLLVASTLALLVSCGSGDRTTAVNSTPSTTTSQSGGSTKEAIAAIQKLNANTETGLNLTTYPPLVAEAKVAIEPLQGTSEGVTAAKVALRAHESALSLWQCDTAGEYDEQDQCRDSVLKEKILPAYPDLKEQADAAYEAKGKPKYLSEALDKQAIIQVLWQKADEAGAIAQQNL